MCISLEEMELRREHMRYSRQLSLRTSFVLIELGFIGFLTFLRNSVFVRVLLEQGVGGHQVRGAVLPFGSPFLCLELLLPSLLVLSIDSTGQSIHL